MTNLAFFVATAIFSTASFAGECPDFGGALRLRGGVEGQQSDRYTGRLS
jgi:hypothetical protein